MLVTADLPSRVGAQVAERLSRADLGRWLAQVQQVGSCAQPIRMVGASDTINTACAGSLELMAAMTRCRSVSTASLSGCVFSHAPISVQLSTGVLFRIAWDIDGRRTASDPSAA